LEFCEPLTPRFSGVEDVEDKDDSNSDAPFFQDDVSRDAEELVHVFYYRQLSLITDSSLRARTCVHWDRRVDIPSH